MKLFLTAIALAAIGANAQSATTTISAPCGTSCPSAPPDKMITRTAPSMSEATPCPSLLVSSVSMNGTGSGVQTGAPTPSAFTGAANHLGGSVAGVIAAAAVALVL